jgi:gamma-glutamyl-gamma-aminobutyrate hydrolase PuuD
VLDRRTEDPRGVVQQADGILLPGGGDVEPAIYGAAPHARFDAAETGRDAYEIALVRAAFDANRPLLAICRGLQVLNVAHGGTLVQDIPDAIGVQVRHDVRDEPTTLAHDVTVTPGSQLTAILAVRLRPDGSCAVNSRHHQAPGRLGDGLIATATAHDGVVEALEAPARRFHLGVQWHPENFWRTGEFQALFDAFVRASASPSDSRL